MNRTWIALFAAFTVTSVSAALEQRSHPAFGAGSITVDSSSGLAWLTPRVTEGLSFLQVSALLTNDLRFSGFRFATTSDLEGLFVAAAIPDINVPGYGAYYGTSANAQPAQALLNLVGATYRVTVAGTTVLSAAGHYGAPTLNPVNGFLSVPMAEVVLRTGVPTASGLQSFASASTDWSSLTVGSAYPGVGSWLVTPVSEPAAPFLALAALAVLWRLRRDA